MNAGMIVIIIVCAVILIAVAVFAIQTAWKYKK